MDPDQGTNSLDTAFRRLALKHAYLLAGDVNLHEYTGSLLFSMRRDHRIYIRLMLV
jgi:hypothetical protein